MGGSFISGDFKHLPISGTAGSDRRCDNGFFYNLYFLRRRNRRGRGEIKTGLLSSQLQIDFGEQLRVKQRAVQGAVAVVDAVVFTKTVETETADAADFLRARSSVSSRRKRSSNLYFSPVEV